MFDLIKKIFGFGPATDYRLLLKEGGKIIDVRTGGEFSAGHIKGSINIPLHKLPSNLGRLDKNKPLIVCCASGSRSSSAKNILSRHGYRVYNGGSWTRLQKSIL